MQLNIKLTRRTAAAVSAKLRAAGLGLPRVSSFHPEMGVTEIHVSGVELRRALEVLEQHGFTGYITSAPRSYLVLTGRTSTIGR